jgi:signal transduction histidine kinase
MIAAMLCPKCKGHNSLEAQRCTGCGASLVLAVLEVVRGSVVERAFFLKGRPYTIGRARHNDIALAEASVSKVHARLEYREGAFHIEDRGSLHGVYVNAARIQTAPLTAGAHVQLGNVTLKFSPVGAEVSTDPQAQFPWIEQQQLLLSVVQTLNSTLVLSSVLEQVLDAVMKITRAERGFLLLAEGAEEKEGHATVAGLRLRVARRQGNPLPLSELQGVSSSVVRRALQTGETVATGNAAADPALSSAQSVILMDLRTIVCIPLRSPRAEAQGEGAALGALYVDNQETSAPFSPESLRTAEALARHAALAIENAQLFEREERTIEQLRSAQKQLIQSEKLATIGQMAAGIAHELNTPLTYIMGNLELFQLQPLSPAQTEMLGSMFKGAERIKSLTQRLLAFSRPYHEEATRLSPNEVVERSLELCHYQILKCGVQLQKELAAGLPLVNGVSNQLEVALINLIVNALQAMDETGGTLTVASSLAGDHVEIAVTDTGTGIPSEVQPTIFEPFFTTKPEGKGTGLGLSTVLMIIERHGGTIDFDSRPRKGTTFRVRLPTLATTLP